MISEPLTKSIRVRVELLCCRVLLAYNFFRPHRKVCQPTRPKRGCYCHVRRIAACGPPPPSDSGLVVPRVEWPAAILQVNFEPCAEAHRRNRRIPDVPEVSGGISGG